MIITGWHSCKYSIFYLYSSSRMQPWGNYCCSFVPPRRERRGPRPAWRDDRPVAAGGGMTPGHMAHRAGLTRTTVQGASAALPCQAGRAWPGAEARGWTRGAGASGSYAFDLLVAAHGTSSGRNGEGKMPAMDVLVGKEREPLGKQSNDHGFVKTKRWRHRGRRGLPSSGGGCRWEQTRWPQKLAGSSPET